MDISTRVGVGGVGLATIVAILGAVIPHLSVWVWGPLLGLSAAMFAWGLWPLARSLSLGHIGLWNVPMATACRIAYEKSETDLVGMAAYRMGASHDDTLGYFFHSFCLQGLPIYGKKMPSTKSRIIPPKELKRLFPMSDCVRCLMSGREVSQFIAMSRLGVGIYGERSSICGKSGKRLS